MSTGGCRLRAYALIYVRILLYPLFQALLHLEMSLEFHLLGSAMPDGGLNLLHKKDLICRLAVKKKHSNQDEQSESRIHCKNQVFGAILTVASFFF